MVTVTNCHDVQVRLTLFNNVMRKLPPLMPRVCQIPSVVSRKNLIILFEAMATLLLEAMATLHATLGTMVIAVADHLTLLKFAMNLRYLVIPSTVLMVKDKVTHLLPLADGMDLLLVCDTGLIGQRFISPRISHTMSILPQTRSILGTYFILCITLLSGTR